MPACARWILIGVCNLVVWGSAEVLVGRLKGSVELPCEESTQNYTQKKFLVYWQRPGPIVVAIVEDRNVTNTNQAEKYKGRASFNVTGIEHGNFTLHLSELSWEDNGTYECIVMDTSSSVQEILRKSMTLLVKEEFSTPSVCSSSPGKTSIGQGVTLTCRTHGGTERPAIKWMNTNERTPINHGQIHHRLSKEGDIFNITSTLTINVTSNINISCLIQTASRNFTSSTYVLELAEDPETGGQHGVSPVVPGTVVALLLVAVVGALVLVRGRICPSSGGFLRAHYKHQATQMATDV